MFVMNDSRFGPNTADKSGYVQLDDCMNAVKTYL